ncbi:MAG: hypothetical protein ACK5EO_07545 [Planctomycetota bacterium]
MRKTPILRVTFIGLDTAKRIEPRVACSKSSAIAQRSIWQFRTEKE